MRQIGADKFKQKCLAILDEVGPDGIIITKNGKPVAKLTRVEPEPSALIGSLRGKIRIHGDIFSTGLNWDAQS
ncbi:MAG: type II toxin-antitoxin system Phd/YefM family antitoxin [Phycisphaerae bacterium]|jgi:prevent-host-death family protein|nr:type II toxin-antitoxin system Phd/YefM family antitoxin [Phycisphaerae bacterium]